MQMGESMSAQRIAVIAMIISILLGLLGCAPRVCVTPNPGPRSKGIRYYRPKPYLKVTPAIVPSGRDASQLYPNLVTVSLEYLPDFSEEYAIDVRSGLGIANVEIKLEDGWNLTEISQELDSQTDENISAAADLIEAIGGVVPTSDRDGEAEVKGFTVEATEVPLGYYEAVISRGPDGRKKLYGFRYLGFFPYEPCPLTMGGGASGCCNDPLTTLYGLTFHDGRMVFRPLTAMQAPVVEEPSQQSTSGEQATSETIPPPVRVDDPAEAGPWGDPAARRQLAANLETSLLGKLREPFPETQSVSASWRERAGTPQLRVEVVTSNIIERTALEKEVRGTLAQLSGGRFLYDVQVRQP
jgi:hypothetical protein